MAKKIKYQIQFTTYNTSSRLINITKQEYEKTLNDYKVAVENNHIECDNDENSEFYVSIRTYNRRGVNCEVFEIFIKDGPSDIRLLKKIADEGYQFIK